MSQRAAGATPSLPAVPPCEEDLHPYLFETKHAGAAAGAVVAAREPVLECVPGLTMRHMDDSANVGTLLCTPYRLIFGFWAHGRSNPGQAAALRIVSLPVADVRKSATSAESVLEGGPTAQVLILEAKDCHTVKLHVAGDCTGADVIERVAARVASMISALPDAQPFATVFGTKFDNDGWLLYDAQGEFERQGVLSGKSNWRSCELSAKDYTFSPTYPNYFMVPQQANDSLLAEVAKFRSKKRIPILSWRHPANGSSITRCAQPLCGPAKSSSEYDELFFQLLACTTGGHVARDKEFRVLIADARPWKNAVANMGRGGGYEARPKRVLLFAAPHS